MILSQGDSPTHNGIEKNVGFVMANKKQSRNIDIFSAFPLVPALQEWIDPSPLSTKYALGFWVSLFVMLNLEKLFSIWWLSIIYCWPEE